MKIEVSQKVFDGLEAVRKSGVTNMFDYPNVMGIAFAMKYLETVFWLKENKAEYIEGIFKGFKVEEISRCDQCGKECPENCYNKHIVDSLINIEFEAMLNLGLTCEEIKE